MFWLEHRLRTDSIIANKQRQDFWRNSLISTYLPLIETGLNRSEIGEHSRSAWSKCMPTDETNVANIIYSKKSSDIDTRRHPPLTRHDRCATRRMKIQSEISKLVLSDRNAWNREGTSFSVVGIVSYRYSQPAVFLFWYRHHGTIVQQQQPGSYCQCIDMCDTVQQLQPFSRLNGTISTTIYI